MIFNTRIIEIFCNLNAFMKAFDTVLTKTAFQRAFYQKRNRKSTMSKSEVVTIMVKDLVSYVVSRSYSLVFNFRAFLGDP